MHPNHRKAPLKRDFTVLRCTLAIEVGVSLTTPTAKPPWCRDFSVSGKQQRESIVRDYPQGHAGNNELDEQVQALAGKSVGIDPFCVARRVRERRRLDHSNGRNKLISYMLKREMPMTKGVDGLSLASAVNLLLCLPSLMPKQVSALLLL